MKKKSFGSNLKLTLISLLGAIGFAGLFAVLSAEAVLATDVFAVAIIVSAALMLLSVLLFSRVKR